MLLLMGKPHNPWPCCKTATPVPHQFVLGRGIAFPVPHCKGYCCRKNTDTCLVSGIRVFIHSQMQTCVFLGFYMPEQTSVGKADVKQCLHLCVFFSTSWVSSSEQGCKTQDLPRAPSSLGAAGTGPGQVDQSHRLCLCLLHQSQPELCAHSV